MGNIIACPLEIGTDVMRGIRSGTVYVLVAFLLPSKVPRPLLHVQLSTGLWVIGVDHDGIRN